MKLVGETQRELPEILERIQSWTPPPQNKQTNKQKSEKLKKLFSPSFAGWEGI